MGVLFTPEISKQISSKHELIAYNSVDVPLNNKHKQTNKILCGFSYMGDIYIAIYGDCLVFVSPTSKWSVNIRPPAVQDFLRTGSIKVLGVTIYAQSANTAHSTASRPTNQC